MHADPGPHVIAQGSLDHLREIQRSLARRGISSEVQRPPAGKCGS